MGDARRELIKRGWVPGPDGGLVHPSRVGEVGIRTVAPAAGEPAPVRPLVKRLPKLPEGARGLGLRVSLIARVRVLPDWDAEQGSFKPLVDAVAAALGVDDGDRAVAWETGYVRTDGEEGVLVTVQRNET